MLINIILPFYKRVKNGWASPPNILAQCVHELRRFKHFEPRDEKKNENCTHQYTDRLLFRLISFICWSIVCQWEHKPNYCRTLRTVNMGYCVYIHSNRLKPFRFAGILFLHENIRMKNNPQNYRKKRRELRTESSRHFLYVLCLLAKGLK